MKPLVFVRSLVAVMALAATAVHAANPILVLNSLDASISVIDPATWKEVKRIPTGKEPHHLYLTPDSKSVIVLMLTGKVMTTVPGDSFLSLLVRPG